MDDGVVEWIREETQIADVDEDFLLLKNTAINR
jgi:hypothetical protein